MRKLNILVVDDELAMRESIAAWLTAYGHPAQKAAGGLEALELLEKGVYDLALIDFKMPGMDGQELLVRIREAHPEVVVIMVTAYGSIESAVEAMKAGAHDYLLKPFDPEQLILLLERVDRHKRLIDHNASLREALAQGRCGDLESMVFVSPVMTELFDRLDKIAEDGEPVFIQGEAGTGKEMIARAIHRRGSKGPFVSLACGVQTESGLEGDLFGWEKGAFGGSVKARRGRLETADGGTLFLDEIAGIPIAVQAKLLAVLEEGQFRRLGGDQPMAADVRLIAATRRDIPAQIEAGFFRRDLFDRIMATSLRIPPLRDRMEDVQPLAEHFLNLFARQTGKKVVGLTDPALAILRDYDWPGNVRELRNVIERAVILGRGEAIDRSDLRFFTARAQDRPPGRTLADIEQNHIRQTLAACDWNVGSAARRLGLEQAALARKIEDYGLSH